MNGKRILTAAERGDQDINKGYNVYRYDETGHRVGDPLDNLSTQELLSVADTLSQQVTQSEAYWLQFDATPDKDINQSYETHEAWRAGVRKGGK